MNVELGAITNKNYRIFSSLLLPEMAEAIKYNEMVIAYGVVEDDVAVGAVAGTFSEEFFQIQSLYVAPEYRRKGYGTALMNELAELFASEYLPIEISFTVTEAEHETLFPFLEKLRIEQEKNSYENIYYSNLEELSKNPLFRKKRINSCVPFAELSPQMFYGLERMHKRQQQFIPMPEGGFFGKGIDLELSYAYIISGEIKAYLTVERQKDGFLISSLWSKTPQSAAAVLQMTGSQLLSWYPPNTILAFQTLNKASYTLAKKLLPEMQPISYTYYRFF